MEADTDLMSAPLELVSFNLQGYKLAGCLSDEPLEFSLPQTSKNTDVVSIVLKQSNVEQISKKLLAKQDHGRFDHPSRMKTLKTYDAIHP